MNGDYDKYYLVEIDFRTNKQPIIEIEVGKAPVL